MTQNRTAPSRSRVKRPVKKVVTERPDFTKTNQSSQGRFRAAPRKAVP